MPRKIIIDTDPGVDDVLAILLACSAAPEELDLLLVSLTFGNIEVHHCLRNAVALFQTVDREIEWRKSQGRPLGFDVLRQRKPILAVGSEHPLAEKTMLADYFHGKDGLGGIHETHPHWTPAETYKALFQQNESSDGLPKRAEDIGELPRESLFVPSRTPAYQEILRLLRENEPDSITIVAVGPLTNLALAAAIDTETFLRAKEVVVMGGTVEERGNVTPAAEFNTFADAYAAARLYALSSPLPRSTMPPYPAGQPSRSALPLHLAPYPPALSRQLRITLFPLDITHRHRLTRGAFRARVEPLRAAGSPLAAWVHAFMAATFDKVEALQRDEAGDAVALDLHDPLCVWYCMGLDPAEWKLVVDEDLRVETAGQWTKGMCVVDRRTRKKREDDEEGERPDDTGNWLGKRSGNRLRRCVGSPGEDLFGELLLKRIFAL